MQCFKTKSLRLMLLLADKCISTLIKWARAWAWARTSIVSKFTHIQRKTLFSYQLLHTIWKRNSNADTSMNVSMSICIKQWWKLTRVGREIFCLFIRLFGEWRNSMRKRDTRFMFKKKRNSELRNAQKRRNCFQWVSLFYYLVLCLAS